MSNEGWKNSESKNSDWKDVLRQTSPDNFYARLGVEPDASDQDIKTKFRMLAQQYHPEVHGGNEEKFKNLSEAYNAVKTTEARKTYNGLLFTELVATMGDKTQKGASPQESGATTTEKKESPKEHAPIDMNSEDWKRRRAEYEERVRVAREREQAGLERDKQNVQPTIDAVRESLRARRGKLDDEWRRSNEELNDERRRNYEEDFVRRRQDWEDRSMKKTDGS